jgi:acyl-CoA thioester hydrolase
VTDQSIPHTAVRISLQMRWSDMDAYAHANNAIYLTYLEEARFRWKDGLFPDAQVKFSALLAPEIVTLIVGHRIEYAHQMFYKHSHGELAVHLWICEIGNSSFTSAGIITDKAGHKVFAKSLTKMVQFNQETQQSSPLTLEVKEYLMSLQGPTPNFHD